MTVTLTNGTAAAVQGVQTVDLYATTTGAIDSASTLVGTLKRVLKVKGSGTATVVVRVSKVALPAGVYTLLPRVTAAGGGTTSATAGPALTVAAATVSLTATVGAPSPAAVALGRPVAITLTITNGGNVNATGPATLAVYLSADGTSLTLPVTTVARRLTVKPGGRAVAVRLRLKVPAGTSAGSFYPVVLVTQGSATARAAGATPVILA